MIKKKLQTYITSCEGINENIIKMNINILGKKVTILGVCGISEDEASVKKEVLYRNLNSVINEIGCSREIIVMEEFNGRTGSRNGSEVVGPYGEDRVNGNGERLI